MTQPAISNMSSGSKTPLNAESLKLESTTDSNRCECDTLPFQVAIDAKTPSREQLFRYRFDLGPSPTKPRCTDLVEGPSSLLNVL